MNVIKIEFPKEQFVNEMTKKVQIILHHTVSSNSTSPVQFWKSNPERVAVPYVIAKDGTVLQLFDSCYWGFHIGKGSDADDNRCAIGIELVNEGILQPDGKGGYTWFDGKIKFSGKVHEAMYEWRGSKFFAAYTEAQYDSLAGLLPLLCEKHNIPLLLHASMDCDRNNFGKPGVFSHRNFRPDKTDLSPAFDWMRLLEKIETLTLPSPEGRGKKDEEVKAALVRPDWARAEVIGL